MDRTAFNVTSDCMVACHQCSGGTTTKDGRLACNLRNNDGKPAPIDCQIPRIAASVEVAGSPPELIAEATRDYIFDHIRDTGPFPPAGASANAKTQAKVAGPVVAAVSAQSSGQPEISTKAKRR